MVHGSSHAVLPFRLYLYSPPSVSPCFQVVSSSCNFNVGSSSGVFLCILASGMSHIFGYCALLKNFMNLTLGTKIYVISPCRCKLT